MKAASCILCGSSDLKNSHHIKFENKIIYMIFAIIVISLFKTPGLLEMLKQFIMIKNIGIHLMFIITKMKKQNL